MNILIAPDKFKGSLTAQEVCLAIEKGIKSIDPFIKTTLLPLADGGEGSIEIIAKYVEGIDISLLVKDPLGRTIEASYLLSGKKAYIEMSAASGLMLLNEEERSPLLTTSYGTGELIADAIKMGAEEIYILLGGSATNDMGIGMAEVLGFQFIDKDGDEVPPVGVSLPFITKIEGNVIFNTDKIKVYAVCDVTNPLYGVNGAAQVYAAQKGAGEEDIEILDQGLKNLSKRCRKYLKKDLARVPGSGAAGGLGGGILAFLNGEIISGAKFILELTGFNEVLHNVDLVITGEGSIDDQSLNGKLISHISQEAQTKGIPVVAICGISLVTPNKLAKMGISECYSIIDIVNSTEVAMTEASQYLEQIASTIIKEHRKN